MDTSGSRYKLGVDAVGRKTNGTSNGLKLQMGVLKWGSWMSKLTPRAVDV